MDKVFQSLIFNNDDIGQSKKILEMKSFFVLFCKNQKLKPKLYQSLQTVRAKAKTQPDLLYEGFATQLEAEIFLYPKKIAYLQKAENLQNSFKESQLTSNHNTEKQTKNKSRISPVEKNDESKLQNCQKQPSILIQKEQFKNEKIQQVYEEILKYQKQGKGEMFRKTTSLFPFSQNDTYKGFFDGCSKGNPGASGVGFLITDLEGKIFLKQKLAVGEQTNNSSEFLALICLLLECRAHGIKRINIYGDSQFVIKGIRGQYKVSNSNLVFKNQFAKILLRDFSLAQIQHIPRNLNYFADKLANQAIGSSPKKS